MSARIYCNIPGSFRGFRELETMSAVANQAWCERGEFWLMYDAETNEVFECAFNSEYSVIVAYREVSIEELRKRLSGAAQSLINARIQEAIEKASTEASAILAEAEKFSLKLHQK